MMINNSISQIRVRVHLSKREPSARTIQRIGEHTRRGHELYRFSHTENRSLFHKPANLFECSCGWLGWLPKDEIVVVELFTLRSKLS